MKLTISKNRAFKYVAASKASCSCLKSRGNVSGTRPPTSEYFEAIETDEADSDLPPMAVNSLCYSDQHPQWILRAAWHPVPWLVTRGTVGPDPVVGLPVRLGQHLYLQQSGEHLLPYQNRLIIFGPPTEKFAIRYAQAQLRRIEPISYCRSVLPTTCLQIDHP